MHLIIPPKSTIHCDCGRRNLVYIRRLGYHRQVKAFVTDGGFKFNPLHCQFSITQGHANSISLVQGFQPNSSFVLSEFRNISDRVIIALCFLITSIKSS